MAPPPNPFVDFNTLIGTIGDLFGTGGSVSGTGSGTSSGIATSVTDAFSAFETESALDSLTTKETEDLTIGSTKERLNIDPRALNKIISDVLSGPEGLASIFAGEQTAGVFDSSVAAQAAGDLATKLVGELFKLTAEREVTTGEISTGLGVETGAETGIKTGGQRQGQTTIQEKEEEFETTAKQESKSGGIIEGITDFLGI